MYSPNPSVVRTAESDWLEMMTLIGSPKLEPGIWVKKLPELEVGFVNPELSCLAEIFGFGWAETKGRVQVASKAKDKEDTDFIFELLGSLLSFWLICVQKLVCRYLSIDVEVGPARGIFYEMMSKDEDVQGGQTVQAVFSLGNSLQVIPFSNDSPGYSFYN